MTVERQFFRTLNSVIEPLVRAGFGSPWIWPTGLVVLECKGRKTGRVHRVPVSATVMGDVLIASTIRAGRSQWLSNLAVAPELTYWLFGQAHYAKAVVFAPGAPVPSAASLPPIVRPFTPTLAMWTGFGMGFAIITSVRGGGAPGS